MNKAVFWDRDGTINVEKKYLHKISDFEFMPGVLDIMFYYKKLGYLQILITNQSGIARGYYSVNDMEQLHEYMQNELLKRNLCFDGIYYCPHHPKGIVKEFTKECQCRKPGLELFERAIKDFEIDPLKSIAIGDKERDLIPARMLGMETIYIEKLLRGEYRS